MRLHGGSHDYGRRMRTAPLGLVLVMSTGVGVAVGVLEFGRSIGLVLALAVVVFALSPTMMRVLQGRFDLFEPTFGAGLMLAILFGIRPIYLISEGQFDYLGYQIGREITAAIGLGLLGTVSFMVGYFGFRRDHLAAPDEQPRDDEPPVSAAATTTAISVGFLAGVLGLALFAVHLLRMGPPAWALSVWLSGRSNELVDAVAGTSEYLSAGPILLACAATAIGVVSAWRLTRWQLLGIAAMATMSAAIFSVGGDRRFLIPSLGVPVVAYYLSTSRRPGRTLMLALVPLAFVVLATIPYGRSAGARDQAGGVVPIFAEAFSAPLTAWNRFITSYDTEMVGALAVQVQLQRGPDDFYYGRATIGDLLIAPIPSALFPAKPITARNDVLIRAFGAPCTVLPGTLCPDFSVIGTFYQDLWWIGVIAGMAALGAMSRAIWMRYRAMPRSPQRVVMAATWTISLPILIRAGFMPSFAWWLYFLVPTLVITALSVALARRFSHLRTRPPVPSVGIRPVVPVTKKQDHRGEAP